MTPPTWFLVVVGIVFFLVTIEFWAAIFVLLFWLLGLLLNAIGVVIGNVIVGVLECLVCLADESWHFAKDSWHGFKGIPKPIRNSITTFVAVVVVFGSVFSLAYFFR